MNSGSPNSAKSDGDATPDPPPDRRRDGLLACACGGTEAERLHRAAMREYLDPIRPGYEGRNPFWNAFATKFIYAPAFGFEPVENAVKYRFTVSHLGTSMIESPRYRKDAPTEDPEPRRVLGPGVPTGRSWSFEADSPQQSLAPVWNDIPAGPGAGHGGGAGRLGTGPGKGRGAGIPAGLPLPAALQRQREALRRGGAHGRPVHPRTPGDPALAHRRGAGP